MSLIDKVCSNVYETMDYDKFKILDGNRKIDTLQVEKIKDSILSGYILNPIIVNMKYEIGDGQHRFTALKLLNMPIHYIVIEKMGLEECQRLNLIGKNWTTKDFVQSYANRGNEYYKKMVDFMFEYDFIVDIQTASYILQNNKNNYDGNLTQIIREGKFKFSDENFKIAISIANKMKEICELTSIMKFVNCQRAFINILKHDRYNHEKMLWKIENQIERLDKIKSTVKISEFYEIISDIYNHRTKVEEKIFFQNEFLN